MSVEQLRHNRELISEAKRAFVDEKRKADEKLLSVEIQMLRESLGLTQAQAARVFGGGPTAFSKYERGEAIQTEAMNLLLGLAGAVPEATTWLLKRAGISPTTMSRTSRFDWVPQLDLRLTVIDDILLPAANDPPEEGSRDWQGPQIAFGGC